MLDPQETSQASSVLEKGHLDARGEVRDSEPVDSSGGERQIRGFKWFLLVASILSSIFIYALDNTIVADVTPAAVNQFGDVANLPWLSVGFILGGVTMVLPTGKIYGLFNAKYLYISSLVMFNIGSAVCGAAPNMNALIVGRVLAGIGGTGLYVGCQVLLSVNTTERERPQYLSFVGFFWGLGTVLGPVVGGAFTEHATWRWAFYINLIIAAVFAPFYIFVLPSFSFRHGESIPARLRQFDMVGTIISIGAISCLIMGISFGGTLYAWDSGTTIALFVVSAVLFAVMGVQQGVPYLTTIEDRVFPSHLLRNWNAILLFAITAAVNCAGFTVIYYVPLYFQFTRGDDAIAAAVRLLPLILPLVFMILLSGHFLSHYSYFQPWYTGGSILLLIGGVFFSRIDENSSTGLIYGLLVVIGVGNGAFVQSSYAVVQSLTPPEDLNAAISFIMLSQLGGIVLGLGISGAVFINTATKLLTSTLPDLTSEQISRLISGTSSPEFQALDPSLQQVAIGAVIHAMSKVYILVYVAAAFCLVASLGFTQRKMFKGAAPVVA